MKPKEWDQVAGNYFEEIQSPFDKDVENPLLRHIQRQPKKESALDLGCGIGNLIPHIKRKFQTITCVDFSEEMIIKAKKNHSHPNVQFILDDFNNISTNRKYDTIFAINSIIQPSIEEIKSNFDIITKLLKSNGIFFGIFPALDSDILRAAITLDKYVEKTGSEKKSIKEVHKVLESESYDFLTGLYENEGKQKHYFRIQLQYRLKKAGFKSIEFDKVKYPWKQCPDDDLHRCREMRLFDWFVKATF